METEISKQKIRRMKLVLLLVPVLMLAGFFLATSIDQEISSTYKVKVRVMNYPSSNTENKVISEKTAVIFCREKIPKENSIFFGMKSAEIKGTMKLDGKEFGFDGRGALKAKGDWYNCYFKDQSEYVGFILYDHETAELFLPKKN